MQLAAIHLSILQDILTTQLQWHKKHLSVWLAQADAAAPGGKTHFVLPICGVNNRNVIQLNLHFRHNVIFALLIRKAEPYGYVYTGAGGSLHVCVD